jgi:hypothetical protein
MNCTQRLLEELHVPDLDTCENVELLRGAVERCARELCDARDDEVALDEKCQRLEHTIQQLKGEIALLEFDADHVVHGRSASDGPVTAMTISLSGGKATVGGVAEKRASSARASRGTSDGDLSAGVSGLIDGASRQDSIIDGLLAAPLGASDSSDSDSDSAIAFDAADDGTKFYTGLSAAMTSAAFAELTRGTVSAHAEKSHDSGDDQARDSSHEDYESDLSKQRSLQDTIHKIHHSLIDISGPLTGRSSGIAPKSGAGGGSARSSMRASDAAELKRLKVELEKMAEDLEEALEKEGRLEREVFLLKGGYTEKDGLAPDLLSVPSSSALDEEFDSVRYEMEFTKRLQKDSGVCQCWCTVM